MLRHVQGWLSRQTGAKITYSQHGEDIIVDAMLRRLGIIQPSYLDIGAYHPTVLSNTALFYLRGCSGVCVEPDPGLFEVIRKNRTRDVCLNAGVGDNEKRSAPFYVMSVPTLNTFSKEFAERLIAEEGEKIERVIDLPLLNVNQVIEKHFNPHPNFLSLDTEENDLQILEALDFQRFRPEVICVETVQYSAQPSKQSKILRIPELLAEEGYTQVADTFINSIFVDSRALSSASR